MKVLAHKPRRPRKKEHFVIEIGKVWVAMCRHDLREGDRTDKGVWIVREKQQDDCICMGCEQQLARPKRKSERRELPCTDPERQVELIERVDGKSLVHATAVRKQWAFCKSASRQERGWRVRTGTAGEVTCERCLKSLGLYEGHTPAKKSDGKISHSAMTELWNAWESWTGERHYSDQRE